MKAEELKCFKSVAAVLGEEFAKKELQKVLDTLGVNFEDEADLGGSFIWSASPQGHTFWWEVNEEVLNSKGEAE